MTPEQQRQYGLAVEFLKDEYLRLGAKHEESAGEWDRRARVAAILRLTSEGRGWLRSDKSTLLVVE